jgi:hypothetical protein
LQVLVTLAETLLSSTPAFDVRVLILNGKGGGDKQFEGRVAIGFVI